VLGGLRARPNEIKAQSSRSTRKNCSLWLCNVHCWNATQYYITETVPLIFPFLQSPDQHHCSDEAKWRLGVFTCNNCSYEWAYNWVQLRYTIQHRTVNLPSYPPDSNHSLNIVCWSSNSNQTVVHTLHYYYFIITKRGFETSLHNGVEVSQTFLHSATNEHESLRTIGRFHQRCNLQRWDPVHTVTIFWRLSCQPMYMLSK